MVRKRLAKQDSQRAALLGLGLRTLGDDFLELVDQTAPSDQALDSSIWTTSLDEQRGVEEKLRNIISELHAQLEAIGMRGLLIVASERYLLDEQRRIRGRLYGTEDDEPTATVIRMRPEKKE